MKRSPIGRLAAMAALAFGLAGMGTGRSAVAADRCVTCHAELDSELALPTQLFAGDVHAAAGLGCADCHGGDPTQDDPDQAMDPKKGYVGAPTALAIPGFCNRCHGDAAYMKRYDPGLPVDQMAKYLTSVHGEKNRKGDAKAAQCASCHPAHQVKPADDPTSSVYAINIPSTCGRCHADSAYMAGYGIPTDQLELYTRSVHGEALLERHDLGAPACNSCHGNHAASPPIQAAIANVCGNCHAFNAELFAGSPHRDAFADQGIPACEICHGAHDIAVLTNANLGEGDESICLNCHDVEDGTRAVAVATAMQQMLDDLDAGYEHADSLLELAERKGMYVEDERFALNDVRQATIQAHTLIHSFSDSLVRIKADSGETQLASVVAGAERKLGESAFRRRGLLISTLIFSLVALLLYAKIRQIEGRQR